MDWLADLDAPAAAMAVLTAMITPAVLISACGLLILSTSTRLARVFDRIRQLPQRFEELERKKAEIALYDERRTMIFEQMDTLGRRGRLLQSSLTLYYLGVATFVATSVAIGVVAAGWAHLAWITVVMQVGGAMMLLAGSLMLILESRLALRMTHRELDFLDQLAAHHGGHSSRSAASGSTRIARRPGR